MLIKGRDDLIKLLKIYFELGEKMSKLKSLCLDKGVVKHENDIAIEDYVNAIKEILKDLPVRDVSNIFLEMGSILNSYSTGENIKDIDSKKLLSLLSKLRDRIFEVSFEICEKSDAVSNAVSSADGRERCEVENKIKINLIKEIESYFG